MEIQRPFYLFTLKCTNSRELSLIPSVIFETADFVKLYHKVLNGGTDLQHATLTITDIKVAGDLNIRALEVLLP